MLQKTMRIETYALASLRCAYEEGCLSSTANVYKQRNRNIGGYNMNVHRRLLRFTSQVENRGLANFKPDVPRSAWEWHSCHQHFHSMEVFATYDLLGERTNKMNGHFLSFRQLVQKLTIIFSTLYSFKPSK